MAPRGRTRFQKVHEYDAAFSHLVLLRRNEEGYRNLSYMSPRAFWRAFTSSPASTWTCCGSTAGGSLPCPPAWGGEIPKLLMAGDYDKAKEVALEMRELFGEDGYYLELQDHGISAQRQVNAGLMRLHQETGIPLVATNDAHYLTRQDAAIQDVLMCIQMGKTVDDPNRMKFETEEFYVKTEAEMAALFPNYRSPGEHREDCPAVQRGVRVRQVPPVPTSSCPRVDRWGRLLREAVHGRLPLALPLPAPGVSGQAAL